MSNKEEEKVYQRDLMDNILLGNLSSILAALDKSRVDSDDIKNLVSYQLNSLNDRQKEDFKKDSGINLGKLWLQV